MKIRIQLFGILAEHLPKSSKGKGEVDLDHGSNIKDLLDLVGIKRNVAFAVNGDHDLDKDHPLHTGDEVLVFTAVSGG